LAGRHQATSRKPLGLNEGSRLCDDPAMRSGDVGDSNVTTLSSKVEGQSQVDAPGDEVSVDVDRLILGRAIQFPIRDHSGLLLLARGAVITPKFKRLLKKRDISVVLLHRDDAKTIVSKLPVEKKEVLPEEPRSLNIDPDVTRRLDSVVKAGLPYVTNLGPAVRDAKIIHGCHGYDVEQRDTLIESQRAATEALSVMMSESLQGGEMDGEQVVDVTSEYLKHLTDDTDCVLSCSETPLPDDELAYHCLRMSILGMALGVEMGLNAENVSRVGVTGLLHDWGMLRVPLEIRQAKRSLSAVEMLEVKKHPGYSVDFLERFHGLPTLVALVSYQVHERIDGSGYPRGRSGENIHPFARILYVADRYVSLTSPRPYRQPLTPYAAMETLLKSADERGADPIVIRALLRVISLFPVGSHVTLSDTSVAKVLRGNQDRYDSPIVELIQDKQGRPVDSTAGNAIIDLSQSQLTVAQALSSPGRVEITRAPHFPGQVLGRRKPKPARNSASSRSRRPLVLKR
jgi:HD-GYP domain-containing protein (c-di-GMP phosphodiesterase class II)